MPRYSTTRNNFLGGELSKRADGRSDLRQYELGCKQIKNFVVMPDGGVTKRPGSRFVGRVKGSSGKTITGCRTFPFVYSETDIYKIMIWTASDGTVNYRVINATTLADATVTVDSSVSGYNCTTATVFAPDGETILFNLDNLQYAQSADVVVFCGAGMRPFVIARTARAHGVTEATFTVTDYLEGTGFGANDVTKIERMPFRDENTSTITMTPSGTTGSITITASSSFFKASHVGAYMRILISATEGYAKITGFTSGTVVSATVLNNMGGTSAVTTWAESAWSPRKGYPRALTYYNSRLCFGGSEFQPDTFWLSQVGDYFQFEPVASGVSDAKQFTLNPSDGQVNLIQWMVGGKKLTIGTSAEEHVGIVEEQGTSLNVQFGSETAHGSAYIQPKKVAYAIPFIQGSKHRVRELVFNFDSDSYVANDLTLLRNDIAEGYWNLNYDENKIRQMAYQESPYPIQWIIDEAGYLYGITRDRTQQIVAWHSHILGGTVKEITLSGTAGANHPARVVSISVTPSPTGEGQRLWLNVQRDINGATEYYLEFLDRYRDLGVLEFIGDDGDNLFYYLDCAKGVISGSAVNSFSGFSHLEGETVGVMADGKWVGTQVVTSGAITLPNSQTANRVVVGFQYKSRLKTARSEGGSAIGSSVGARRRIDTVRMNVYKTRFFKFGFEGPLTLRQEIQNSSDATQTDAHDSRLEQLAYVDPGEVVNQPFYTISQIIEKPAPAGYDDKGVAIILSELPYPCNILGITVRAVEADV